MTFLFPVGPQNRQIECAVIHPHSREIYQQAAAKVPGFRVSFYNRPASSQFGAETLIARIANESTDPNFTAFWDQVHVLVAAAAEASE